MPRKKKTEEVIENTEVKQEIKEIKVPDFGSGWTGKNNKIQYELREVKRNE